MNRTGVVIPDTAADRGLLFWAMVMVMTVVDSGTFSFPSWIPRVFWVMVTLTDDISECSLR